MRKTTRNNDSVDQNEEGCLPAMEVILRSIKPSAHLSGDFRINMEELISHFSKLIEDKRKSISKYELNEAEDRFFKFALLMPKTLALLLQKLLESKNLREDLGMLSRLITVSAFRMEEAIIDLGKAASIAAAG